MFDFLKSLFGAKDEEILKKVASIKATEGTSINKTNNLTKEIDANKADNANKLDGPLFKNEKDGKWGYVNTKGEQVIECKFDGVSDFSEGLAAVKKDDNWGYVNTKGEQVVECKFDDAEGFNEGLARVEKDDKWGYINTKGEQVIECKFDDAWDFSEGLAMVKKGHKRFIINIKGDFVALKEDDSKIEITKEISDKSGNVFLLSKSDDKFGLLDTNHNVLIKNKLYGEFEVVQRMNENTFLIKMAEKEFFIDSNGDFK